MKRKKIGAYDRLQVPDHGLGGYSHRERLSRTRWSKSKQKKPKRRENNIFEPILKKKSTIASRATPIGSTSRAPDDNGKYWLPSKKIIDFIVDNIKQVNSLLYSHRERFVTSWRKTTRIFPALKQSNKAYNKLMILELRHHDKSLNVVVIKIMKVRPQDPSCMA
jgi:hypothetical protein